MSLGAVLYHAGSLGASVIYPAYASFLAASHDPRQAATVWLTYWVLFGVVCQVELSLQTLIDWIPAFSLLKLGGALWLTLPQTRGAELIYSSHLAPVFDKLAESRKKREPPLKSELKATAKEASRAPKSAAPDHADEVLGKAADFLKMHSLEAYNTVQSARPGAHTQSKR